MQVIQFHISLSREKNNKLAFSVPRPFVCLEYILFKGGAGGIDFSFPAEEEAKAI